MPEIGAYAFARVNAQVSYPIGDATWSKDKLQNYGGQLNWIIPQEEESEDASAIVSVEPEKASEISDNINEKEEKTEEQQEKTKTEEIKENTLEEQQKEITNSKE